MKFNRILVFIAAFTLYSSQILSQNKFDKDEHVQRWVLKIMSDAKERGMHINFLQASDLKYQNSIFQSFTLEPNKEYTLIAIAETGIQRIVVKKIENDVINLFAEEENDILITSFQTDKEINGIFSVTCFLKDIINPGKYFDMYGKTLIVALCSKSLAND